MIRGSPVDEVRQLLERLHAVASSRLGDVRLRLLQPLGVDALRKGLQRVLDPQVRVPDLEVLHRSERVHGLAIRAHGLEHDHAPLLLREVELARGDREARRQALEVPLPRARRRLVEVVDVEDELPLRRAEHAEVGEVRIPAELDAETRVRSSREIRGHDQRPTAVERERRDEHPAVPNRDELRHAGDGLLLEQPDRVAMRWKLDLALGGPRDLRPGRFASRRVLGRREVHDDFGRRLGAGIATLAGLRHWVLPSGRNRCTAHHALAGVVFERKVENDALTDHG